MKFNLIILVFVLLCNCTGRQKKSVKSIDHWSDSTFNLKVHGELKDLTVYSAAAGTDTVVLKEEGRFGLSKDVIVGRMLGAKADDRDRVYISDMDQRSIHVFEPDGSYLRSLGRGGRGPGEFNMIRKMVIAENRLYVHDGQLMRINVFSLDSLALVYSVQLQPASRSSVESLQAHSPASMYVQDDEKILIRYQPMLDFEDAETLEKTMKNTQNGQDFFYRVNKQGEIISEKIFENQTRRRTLINFRGNSFVTTFPFYERSLTTVSDEGHLYSANTAHFLIKEFNTDGEYLRAYYVPYTNSTLHREELIDRFDISGNPNPSLQYVKKADLPETWPALNSIRTDNKDRLWVSTITDDKKVYQWWILNKSGDVSGRFVLSRSESIEDIKGEHVYTKKYDEEIKQQVITKYRIEFRTVER